MRVLVIAPHPDDEVLGCGGTIAKYVSMGDNVYVCIVTKGCEPLFSQDSVDKVMDECKKADALLGVKETIFLDFPAAMMEEVPRYKLNDAFIKTIQEIKPEIVYLPHRGDMQLDHKMTVDAAMVALRPKYDHMVKKIYAYETLSETGWDIPNIANEFIPNVYNDVSEFMGKKLDAFKKFTTQLAKSPNPRSLETVEALAKFRGNTVSIPYAEAFMLLREVKVGRRTNE